MSRRRISWSLAAVTVVAAVGGALWYARSHALVPPDERFRQALVALRQGDLNATAAAATALEADPQYASHALLLDAGLMLKRGLFDQALMRLALVNPEGDLREPALLLTGETLYRLGQLTEAEGVLRQLAREHPDHADAHRWLGAIYFDLGANDAAIAELTRVVELDPHDYAPHRLMGLMRHDFEQNTEAIEHYRKALALSPPSHVRQEILRELAKSLIAERRYDEALEHLDEAEPDAEVLALRAECCWSLGRSDEARAFLDQARSADPDETLVALLESRILMNDGQPQEAAAVLRRALQRDPHNVRCRYQLALAYRQLGDHERHEAEMSRWQESNDLQQKLTELSIQAIEQPRNAAIRDQLARIWDALGKPEMAAMWRQAAAACRAAAAGREPGS